MMQRNPPTHFRVIAAFLSVLLAGSVQAGHQCVHDRLNVSKPVTMHVPYATNEKMTSAPLDGRKRMHALDAIFESMRIRVFFDPQDCSSGTCGHCLTLGQSVPTYTGSSTVECRDVDILTPSKRDYMMNVLMSSARTWLQAALNVRRVSGNFEVGPTRCGSNPGIPVPDEHRSPGVADADYVVYVTAVPMPDPQSGTVAWAFACAQDQNGRPIVGHVNFVPARLTNAATRNDVVQREDVATAVHEIAHALGFSAPFFRGGFVDLEGERQPQSAAVETLTSAALGKSVTVMKTPRVLREARAYFGCEQLAGVEIEDQGGSGTAGSHWEKRLFAQEFMNGVSSAVVSYYSRVTLAFFEDTGHYTANYAAATDDGMTWGKGKGCAFAQQRCDHADVRAGGEFCFDESRGNGCTHDRTARGYCNVARFSSSLPEHFQYFTDPVLGSEVQVDDFCPSFLPFSNRVCIDGTIVAESAYGESYRADSRCFTANILRSGFSVSSNPTVRCLRFSCAEGGSIRVHVDSQTVQCPADGTAGPADMSTLSGYNGNIQCPEAKELGCYAAGEGPTTAPTAAPTPAPPPAPTSAPTPVPVGQTPTPPEWTPSPPTPAPPLGESCADRAVCAAGVEALMPMCRQVVDRLLACFGTNCNRELRGWLQGHDLVGQCGGGRAAVAEFGAARCVEASRGAEELCFVYSGAASFSLGTWLYVTVLGFLLVVGP